MPSTSVQKADSNSLVGGVAIDYEAVLKTLNLNPRDPATQALVLICERYGLDPVLKHMVLIQSTPYVTHKGLWHIAHRSGELDGEEVLNQGETDSEWFATVGIYRKGWAHPITMTGRYPKGSSNKHYGPEMAVVRAECLVLRRLFDVAVPVQEERDWERESTPAPPRAAERGPMDIPLPADDERNALRQLADPETGEKRSTRRPPPGRRPALSSETSEPAGSVTPADEAGAAPSSPPSEAPPAGLAPLASTTERAALRERLNALEGKARSVFRESFGELNNLLARDVGRASDFIKEYEA